MSSHAVKPGRESDICKRPGGVSGRMISIWHINAALLHWQQYDSVAAKTRAFIPFA